MAGIERKDNDNKKQNRYASKQTNQTKEISPMGHLLSVVQINILCLWWHTLKGLVGGVSRGPHG